MSTDTESFVGRALSWPYQPIRCVQSGAETAQLSLSVPVWVLGQHQSIRLFRNASHHDTCRFSSLSAYVSNGSRSRVASVLRPHRNTSSEAATAAMMHATMGAGRSAWGNDFGANAPPSMSFTNHSQSVSRDEVKSATRSCTTCYKAKAKCVRKLGEQNCERYDFPFWLRGALAGLRRHEILPLGQSRTV